MLVAVVGNHGLKLLNCTEQGSGSNCLNQFVKSMVKPAWLWPSPPLFLARSLVDPMASSDPVELLTTGLLDRCEFVGPNIEGIGQQLIVDRPHYDKARKGQVDKSSKCNLLIQLIMQ